MIACVWYLFLDGVLYTVAGHWMDIVRVVLVVFVFFLFGVCLWMDLFSRFLSIGGL